MPRIAVIGAGPVGSHAAECLAKLGYEVHLFEEHKEVGAPIQCTGILSSSVQDILPPPEDCILTRVKKAEIVGPNGKSTTVSFRRPNLVVDRRKFDKALCERAVRAGATLHLKHKLVMVRKLNCTFSFMRQKVEVPFDYIIGADGPLSTVAKTTGLFRNRKFWTGMQAVCRLPNKNVVRFFPHIATIGWVVPETPGTVRIGCMGRKGVKEQFHHLLALVLGPEYDKDIIEIQGGLIPRYQASVRTERDERIFLVGDAACQVKATTGGGIIPGLKAARVLARCIYEDIPYAKAWKKEIGLDLWAHHQMRRVLDNLSPKAYNDLIRNFSKPGLKTVLGKVEREYPMRLALRLLLNDPSLIRYSRYLI
jgi:digeranylgeranylglycerophospholipid reductase